MNIEKSMQAYEAWLGGHTTPAQADLDFKHQHRHAGWLSAMIESTQGDSQAWKKNGDKQAA